MNNEHLQFAFNVGSQALSSSNFTATCNDYNATASNIWNNPYSLTFWFKSVQSWQNGLKLDSYYSDADVCLSDITNTLNNINGLNVETS